MEKTSNTQELIRICSVCEQTLDIGVDGVSGEYIGGHYFGAVKLRWWQRSTEYWECEECYIED